jgi:phosphatidylserine/phosphatidylglycerophosphate/cardiolipin synthase-like enzyme
MEKSPKLIADQDYLDTLLNLLSKARHSIDILSFSFAIGSSAGKISYNGAPYKIAEKLKQIKELFGDDIKIRFFTEGLRETADRNSVTAEFLEACGVEVKYGSTHAKGFCIDKQVILFGSTNLTNQSIMKNHEANILIDDAKASKEFLRYFNHLWKGGHHGDIVLRSPFIADGYFKDVLIDVINDAEKQIDFSIYFFNHREIEDALVSAHQRGVKIRGFIHQHLAFALPYIRANRATVKRMKAAGIEELYFGDPGLFSHSKYLVADKREVLLGTGNWLVEDVFIHPQLYYYDESPALAKSLLKHLELQIRSVLDSPHEKR